MGKLIDLTGKRFGRLTVIGKADDITDINGRVFHTWKCKCDCGNIVDSVRTYYLTNGQKKSCGCFQNESNSEVHTKHCKRKTRLYGIWQSMKTRCNNKNHKYFKNYGGKGINVCKEWTDDFQAFYDWAMSNGYADGLSIDRIDSKGNYEPSNCRWATPMEQTRNRSNTKRFTLGEIAEIEGISYQEAYKKFVLRR